MAGLPPSTSAISSRTASGQWAEAAGHADVGGLGGLQQHLDVDTVDAVGAGDDGVQVEVGELGYVGGELPGGDDEGLEGVDVDPLLSVYAVEQRPGAQAAEGAGGV